MMRNFRQKIKRSTKVLFLKISFIYMIVLRVGFAALCHFMKLAEDNEKAKAENQRMKLRMAVVHTCG